MPLTLVVPAAEHLESFVAALETGWSPDSTRPEAAAEALEAIRRDPDAVLAGCSDIEAEGPPVTLPDGSLAPRLPGMVRWIWDGGFCGSIGFRWQKGTAALPAHVMGHIGYNVVPWRRGRGCATWALGRMLEEARRQGLPHVELTTTPDNPASIRVIEANGGRLVERFEKPPAYGGGQALRFHIDL